MANRFKRFFLVGFSLLFISTLSEAQKKQSSVVDYLKRRISPELSCQYVSAIEEYFLGYHAVYSSRTPELEARVVEQLLKSKDPLKIYFTETDIANLKSKMGHVFSLTQKADCSFLNFTQQLLIERMEERVSFVKSFLGKAYKLDKKTSFVYDPDKREWAKNKAEIEDFIRKYVHFQIATYMAMDIKLKEAKEKLNKNYSRSLKRVKELKEDDQIVSYLDSFARSLDPHTSFFSKDYLEDFTITMSLELEGIGATLSSQDGFTVVEQLVPGGAAARSKLVEPQDKILAVAQGESGKFEEVFDMDLKDVVKKIRGKSGTKVRLKILRKQGDGSLRTEVTLVRAKVNLEDEAASITYLDQKVGSEVKKIGIINLPSFYADSRKGGRSSAEDVKRLVHEAREKKADGLVLDLSTNGGGSLTDAVELAGLFFKTGNVVRQSSRIGSKKDEILADQDEEVDWSGPLVVLTSRVSASASEIVSGTLQDYQRALIVGGDHTFGKGTVQQVVPINGNLGALKVTVGMFYIPGGRSTQHRGVEADVVLPGAFSNDEMGEKSLDYSLPPTSTAPFLSQSAYVTSGADAWIPISKSWISQLQEKSKIRVAASSDFTKIMNDVKKAQSKGKKISVADILTDKAEKDRVDKEKAKREMSKDEKIAEYLKRADIRESVNVLVDLMEVLKGQQPNGVNLQLSGGHTSTGG